MADDLTPPPDEALPGQSRARIRAELLAAAQEPGARRLWWVPVVAAAAVLTVVGLGTWVVRAGGEDGGTPVVAPGSTAAPDDPEPSEPTGKATVNLSTCVDPVGRLLAGAAQVATFPSDVGGGETTVWVADEEFALCDVRAGTTTVLTPRPLEQEERASTYAVTSVALQTADGARPVWVAGGVVPEAAMAYDVSYTFPDGQVERATTTTDGEGRTWWRMVHTASAGGATGPIQVAVRYSGVQHDYTLP